LLIKQANKQTSDQEVASDDEHHADGREYESGAVVVVLIAHEADATHRVPVHLEGAGPGNRKYIALQTACTTYTCTILE